MKPPVARRIPRVDTRHGRSFEDDYAWLRDRSNPEVMEYLAAENTYTDAAMKPTERMQGELYDEILGRIKQTDESVPARIGPFHYYRRTEEGKQYAIHCRRRGGLQGSEEVLLDENLLAAEHEYFRLGALEISPDHRLLAFAYDTDGGESYTVRFRNLETGAMLEDEIRGAYASVEWAADNRTIFYNTIDAAHRPYRILRHVLGDDSAKDACVHEERDEAFFLGLYKTKDERYLMMHADSNTTSEVWFLDAAKPRGRFQLLRARQPGVEYTVEHHGERFLILTNENAINFKLMSAAVADPSPERWQELIPHRLDVKLDDVQPFAGHLVVAFRENGLTGIRVIRIADGTEHDVQFDEPVYTVHPLGNPEFDSAVVRFSYSSLTTPDSVFDYAMEERRRTLMKEQEVLGGYDRSAYESARTHARAADGTLVPISLVQRKGLKRDGGNPLVLYGYGSYGISVDPVFDSGRLSLLDRGVIYAIAHIRGGGDMGRPWYEAGKLMNKRNTFTDFIACAEHLVAEGYTSDRRLAIRGGSAGGLLMGAVANMRPDLFRVVVAKVPFVDVVNTMLDATIPLTVIEREEWGDPRVKSFHDYMLAYSPYDNVDARPYGDILILSGLNDPRVAFWEPAKWAARLRARKTGDGLLLLKTNMTAGHGGASGRYDRIRELAFEYAFILSRLAAEGGES